MNKIFLLNRAYFSIVFVGLAFISSTSFAQPGSRVCAIYTPKPINFHGHYGQVAAVFEFSREGKDEHLMRFIRAVNGALTYGASELTYQYGNKCPEGALKTLRTVLDKEASKQDAEAYKSQTLRSKDFTSCEKLGRAIKSKKIDVCDKLKRGKGYFIVASDTDGALKKISFKSIGLNLD